MDQSNLNMRQWRWLDVVNDYDHEILYHLSKVNVVGDAMSHRAISTPIQNPCLRTTVVTIVLEMSRVTQSEAIME